MEKHGQPMSAEQRAENLRLLGRDKDARKVEGLSGMEVYWRAIYAAHVRQLRRQMGLTQESFADTCGISANYVSEIERGVCNVTLSMICQIAEATGVHPRWFLEDDPHSPFWDEWVDPTRADPICRPWDWDKQFKSVFGGRVKPPKTKH